MLFISKMSLSLNCDEVLHPIYAQLHFTESDAELQPNPILEIEAVHRNHYSIIDNSNNASMRGQLNNETLKNEVRKIKVFLMVGVPLFVLLLTESTVIAGIAFMSRNRVNEPTCANVKTQTSSLKTQAAPINISSALNPSKF